jgi:hypothetical protein
MKSESHAINGEKFTIEMPGAFTHRANAISMRWYLTDEEQRTYGPWVDVEATEHVPKEESDLALYSTGFEVTKQDREADGSWLLVLKKGDKEIRAKLWRPHAGRKGGLSCEAYQQAEAKLGSPDKVRERLVAICKSLRAG